MLLKQRGQGPLVTYLVSFILTCHALPNSNVRFSKLLNEKSEFLRFTSIANTAEGSPRFQNVYNRADDVQRPEYDLDFPQSRLITEPREEEDFVRIRQGLHAAPPTLVQEGEGTLTRINQKDSGRSEVTALRQATGNKLNISPLFLSSHDQQLPPNDAGTEAVEEDEVTTVQNFELAKDDPEGSEGQVTSSPPTPAPPRVGVTVFDNRTDPDPVDSTTPVSVDLEENFVAESFHRHGGPFPDFEDLPTQLAGAESSQPARVNVRPASSGKNYEYEYIYYYYDDEDDDNSTTPNPYSTTPKADLTGHQAESSQLRNSNSEIEPSNHLDPQRIHKALATAPEVVSIPNPGITTGLTPVLGSNRPIVIKQSNMVPPNGQEEAYPQIPRANPNLPGFTTPPSESTSQVPRQQHEVQSKFKAPPSSANHFEPPIIQFKFVESHSTPPSTPPAVTPPRPNQRTHNSGQRQFEAQRQSQEAQPREAPVPRRTPNRRPQEKGVGRVEPELQQQGPLTEHHFNGDGRLDREEGSRPGRTRGTSPVPMEGQFQPPLIPSRGSDAILEVQPPALETTTAFSPPSEEDKARENFARQKSINDLYALSRLHQLAINTKVPDKRLPESGSRGSPPRISGGFVRRPELTTFHPDAMEGSESTTISSYSSFPPSFLSTLDVQRLSTTEHLPLVSPTNHQALSSLPPSLDSPIRERPNGRFRGKRPLSPTTSTTSTTTEGTPRAYQHNRFTGRRRNFPEGGQSSVEAHEPRAPLPSLPSAAPANPDVEGPPLRPSRNRFAARTRPTTSTTQSSVSEVEPVESSPRTPIRRPLGGGLNQRRRFSTSTPTPQAKDSEAPTPEEPLPSRPPQDVGRRPLNRVRGGTGGVGPIVGRPLRGGRTSTTTSTTTEHPEPAIVTLEETETPSEVLGTTILESLDPLPTSQVQEASPGVITQKVSVSSSTTTSESAAEPPKRGSAGVLGRLRSRTKAAATFTPNSPTSSPPEVVSSTTERKASRVSGILNRRKSTSSTSSPIAEEASHPETAHESEGVPPNGVIVQVSSVVSESEDSSEVQGPPEEPSGVTPGSILNRLKSQRKPGSLFRRRPE